MSNFIRHGNIWAVASTDSMEVFSELPPHTFIVGMNPMTNQFFLERVEQPTIPAKRYGDNDKRANRILNTFMNRSNNTGVMLAGEKGSGKTLLAKTLSVLGAKLKLPTIIINSPFGGDEFNSFMQKINTPCIVLFDEFEKVYDRDNQNAILTLLDGVFTTKKLFVLTCNDKWKVGEHFHNRPGRLFYQFEYEGLDEGFIEEYCQDNLKNKDHTNAIIKLIALFETFNFDMLQALVEDMNRYDEPPQETIKFLNCKPSNDRTAVFTATLTVNGKEIKDHGMRHWDRGVPILLPLIRSWYEVDDPMDENTYEIFLTQKDIKEVNPRTGIFVYEQGPLTVTFTRVQPAAGFSYERYMDY